MKDFLSSFDNDKQDNSGNQAPSGYADIESLAKSVAESFGGKGEGAILNAVLAEAKKNRAAGVLSDGDLENFYNMLSPMLDKKKQTKLREIIDKLKKL